MRTYYNTISKIFCIAESPVDCWENSDKILKWDSTENEQKKYKLGLRVWKK